MKRLEFFSDNWIMYLLKWQDHKKNLSAINLPALRFMHSIECLWKTITYFITGIFFEEIVPLTFNTTL